MDTNIHSNFDPRGDSQTKPNIVKIRRKVGGRGFYHAGRVVEEGETIECDHDIATMLVKIGKAERA